jgi:hypothetical protein
MKKIFLFLSLSILIISCNKDEHGCTDPIAMNFDYIADIDDGSCKYKHGCTDINATNYDREAVIEDNSCVYDCSCGTVVENLTICEKKYIKAKNICTGNERTFYVTPQIWSHYKPGDFICLYQYGPW